jgi:hypothetical protein
MKTYEKMTGKERSKFPKGGRSGAGEYLNGGYADCGGTLMI